MRCKTWDLTVIWSGSKRSTNFSSIYSYDECAIACKWRRRLTPWQSGYVKTEWYWIGNSSLAWLHQSNCFQQSSSVSAKGVHKHKPEEHDSKLKTTKNRQEETRHQRLRSELSQRFGCKTKDEQIPASQKVNKRHCRCSQKCCKEHW